MTMEVIRSSMSPCWTRWWVGAWLINFYMTQMSEQNKTNSFDGTLKRVHTEVIDSSSDDELNTKSDFNESLAKNLEQSSHRLFQSKKGSKA